jgi:hypothetical protein
MGVGEIATAADVPTHRAAAILRQLPEARLLYSSKWVRADVEPASA